MESFLISNVRNYDNLGVELIANDRVCPMALSPVKARPGGGEGGGCLGSQESQSLGLVNATMG